MRRDQHKSPQRPSGSTACGELGNIRASGCAPSSALNSLTRPPSIPATLRITTPRAHSADQRTARSVYSPCTSTVSPGSILPEFGLTQYCFGAVVLTLYTIGCELWFETARVRLTNCVSGPVVQRGWRQRVSQGSRRGRERRKKGLRWNASWEEGERVTLMAGGAERRWNSSGAAGLGGYRRR